MSNSLYSRLSTRPWLSALLVLTLSVVGCNARSTVLSYFNGTAGDVTFTATGAAIGTLTHPAVQPGNSAYDIISCRRTTDTVTVTADGTACSPPQAWNVAVTFTISPGLQYTSTVLPPVDNGTVITYTLTVYSYNPKTRVTAFVTSNTTTTPSCTTSNP